MNMKKHAAETLTLVGAAVLCAFVANALARNERRLKVPGDYPNALKVPAGASAPAPETPPPTPVPTEVVAVPTPEPTPAPAHPAATAPAKASAMPAAPVKPVPTAAPKKPDLSRFAPHKDKAYIEVHGDEVATLFAGG